MIVNSLDGLATVDFPTAGNYDVRLAETRTIERFHSLGQHLCRFIGTKERVYIKKEFNSTRLSWNTNMAAVSLFCNKNMATVTSCENALYILEDYQ